MNKKSKIRLYVEILNAVIMGFVFFSIGDGKSKYISLLGMLSLIIINYLDGHLETKD